MLWLPPGAYAITRYEGTSQTAYEIHTASLTFDIADAPWFVIDENETTYFGSILFNFDDSRLHFRKSTKAFEAELKKTKRKLKFKNSYFVTNKQTKEKIGKKFGLKNVVDNAVIIDD